MALAMPTQPCPPPPSSRTGSFGVSPNISNQAPVNFNCGAQTVGMSIQERQQMMRERQLAQLAKQRNRKPFGAVVNDLPATAAIPSIDKTGWGKIIAVGVDQPGCMADAKKSNDGGGITVIKSPVNAGGSKLQAEEKNNSVPGTPAKTPSEFTAVAPVFTDEDVIDIGGFEEVRAGGNGNEAARNKKLREDHKTEPSGGGWDLDNLECVRGPSPVFESTMDVDEDDMTLGTQKKKSKGWKLPWQKKAPEPAPVPVRKPKTEDTGVTTCISSFNDVPSTPPQFSGPNKRIPSSISSPSSKPGPSMSSTTSATTTTTIAPSSKPGRRNRGGLDENPMHSTNQTNAVHPVQSFGSQEQSFSSAKDSLCTQIEDPYSNGRGNSRKSSVEVTNITSMAVAEDDEDKPKFSRPKRNVRAQQDVLPGCLIDEPEEVIGWD